MQPMSVAKFCRLAEKYQYIPLWLSLPADMDTPVSLVKKLDGCVYLLESVEQGEILGRYSFIGIDSLLKIEVRENVCQLTGESRTQVYQGNPLQTIETILKALQVAPVEELNGFIGGAVGFFAYSLVNSFEGVPQRAENDLGIPDCQFVVARSLIRFDHINHKVTLIALTPGGFDPQKSYAAGMDYLRSLAGILQSKSVTDKIPPKHKAADISANMTREQFIEKVQRAKEYIAAGDIFQVVLSQRFSLEVSGEPFDIYRRLRAINPSPYLYYLDFADLQLIGSSPEMLVRVTGSAVETCPIAGTRPRGKSPVEDSQLGRELRHNPKEQAEHVMLVDLSRNDLGRVCDYGSVELASFMGIERFSHVMHLVSRVKGRLEAGRTPLDALKVCFPAGTVSGAPKIRAMEIIEELEPTRRGPYAGAIAYLGFDANLDSCITIRTILVKAGRAFVQAGAGIVADSDPDKEYAETLNKAGAMLAAVNPVEEENNFAIND